MQFKLWIAAQALPLALMAPAAHAQGWPVIDVQAILQAVQQVEQAKQIVQEATQTVGALTNIPKEAISSIEGLLQQGIQNPLQGIGLNLQTLLTGQGTGTCAGSAGMLALQQYQKAVGADFMGASINGSAARLAGLQACTQQMLQAQQQRLEQLPGLLDELKACTDVACTTSIEGRLQYENAMQTAQGNEATLMGWNAQLQRWTAEDQITQKQRADAQQVVDGTGGNTSGLPGGPPIHLVGLPPTPTFTPATDAPMFSANGGG